MTQGSSTPFSRLRVQPTLKGIWCLVFPVLIGSAAQAQDQGDFRLRKLIGSTVQFDRNTLPPVYDYKHLGIFCKLDVQLEKHLLFPVRFRLGDPLRVEEWEGKGPLGVLMKKH